MYITSACPLCGRSISVDLSESNPEIITIRTRRRSTVLVHKHCYDMGNAIRKENTK